jgi:hypothetical protein
LEIEAHAKAAVAAAVAGVLGMVVGDEELEDALLQGESEERLLGDRSRPQSKERAEAI